MCDGFSLPARMNDAAGTNDTVWAWAELQHVTPYQVPVPVQYLTGTGTVHRIMIRIWR
jgi:hypothetical protein